MEALALAKEELHGGGDGTHRSVSVPSRSQNVNLRDLRDRTVLVLVERAEIGFLGCG
jgi:hypothetical protein